VTSTSSLPGADEVMAKAGAENFPVAPPFLPRATRRHLRAIYGYARLVDDTGDEAGGVRGTPGTGPPEDRADRLALLDRLAADLELVWHGEPAHPVLRALAPTVRELRLPPQPFQRLLDANRQDQRVHRYQTFEALLGYCELSANPVGELVLHVFGAATGACLARSDAICTALQLTEHWQDVAEDLRRDRVYLPREDLDRFGVSEAELAGPDAGDGVRRLVAFEVARTAALFDQGAPLVGMLAGPARLAVAAFLAGGRAALAAVARAPDLLVRSPHASRGALARELAAVLARSRRRARAGSPPPLPENGT
jgi:squalene synthase HpnC